MHAGVGGIKSDLAQAALWIKKAADTGHEKRAIRYADILLCGIGCAICRWRAPMLRQSIERGSWRAMNTSFWYQSGSCGFRQIAALSTEWRNKADATQRDGAALNHRLVQVVVLTDPRAMILPAATSYALMPHHPAERPGQCNVQMPDSFFGRIHLPGVGPGRRRTAGDRRKCRPT